MSSSMQTHLTDEAARSVHHVERGDMAYSERVIMQPVLKPSVVSYSLAALTLTLLSTVGGIIFLPFLLPCVYFAYKSWYRSVNIVLTEHNIIYRQGFFACCCLCWNTDMKRIPLQQITDVILSVGCVQRCYGVSTVAVQTAGKGSVMPELQIIGLEDPEAFIDAVMDARRKLQSHSGQAEGSALTSSVPTYGSTANNAGPVVQTPNELVEVRDTLLRMEKMFAAMADTV